MTIDLNCDVGEREDFAGGEQEELLTYVTSANIACGAHAGSTELMRLTLRQALARGVSVGAHPGYPDRANAGRLAMEMPLSQLEAEVEAQIMELARLAGECGAELQYVKPHGALYNQAARDRNLARTIARAIERTGLHLAIVGLAGSPALTVWRDMGYETVAEAFIDRRYQTDGSLQPRHYPHALLQSPAEAAEQALRIALHGEVIADDGSVIHVDARTLCVHGDSPGAVAMARSARTCLDDAGVNVCAWTGKL